MNGHAYRTEKMAISEMSNLERRLKDLLPSASISVLARRGRRLLVCRRHVGQNTVTVRWCQGEPYGLASHRNNYGGGPDETYQNADDVVRRIQEILVKGKTPFL